MIDEDHDDGLGGRSRDRREITEANRWARPLCALSPAALAAAPVPEEVREQVRLANTMKTARARNREHQRVDKLVRSLEPEAIEAIDAFLADPDAAARTIDRWCDRLIDEGDPTLDRLVDANPAADRQRLRTLVRNAKKGGDRPRASLREALVAIEGLAFPE